MIDVVIGLRVAGFAAYTAEAVFPKEMLMSKNEVFLKKLRHLLDDIPEDLTLPEAQWALRDVVFAVGCRIVCKWGRQSIEQHVPGTGPHRVVTPDPAVDLLKCSLNLAIDNV